MTMLFQQVSHVITVSALTWRPVLWRSGCCFCPPPNSLHHLFKTPPNFVSFINSPLLPVSAAHANGAVPCMGTYRLSQPQKRAIFSPALLAKANSSAARTGPWRPLAPSMLESRLASSCPAVDDCISHVVSNRQHGAAFLPTVFTFIPPSTVPLGSGEREWVQMFCVGLGTQSLFLRTLTAVQLSVVWCLGCFCFFFLN